MARRNLAWRWGVEALLVVVVGLATVAVYQWWSSPSSLHHPDAAATGLRADGLDLWVAPSDPDAIYLRSEAGTYDRLPRATRGTTQCRIRQRSVTWISRSGAISRSQNGWVGAKGGKRCL